MPSPDAAELLAHASWLRRLARELTRDAADAEDLAQGALAAALANPPERGALRPWLAAVARNLERLRARGARHRAEREELGARAEALPDASDLVERAELQRLVVELVLALREPYRATLLLRFYEGVQPIEIARRQGVPAGTVRSRLKRGIDELREELDRRARGGRAAWCSALAPLALERQAAGHATWIGGFAMKAVTTAIAIAAAAAAGGFFFSRSTSVSTGVETELPRRADDVASSESSTGRGNSTPTPDGTDTVRAEAPPSAGTSARAVQAPAPALSARLEGVVLDDSTGEPLADYALALVLDAGEERLVTDAAGRFASGGELPEATYRLRLLELRAPDDRIQIRRADAEALASELLLHHAAPFALHELRVPSGPTLRFVLDPAPAANELESFAASLACADRSQAFDRVHARLRAGELAWARFGATARLLSGGPPWRVGVQCEDGYAFGEAELADLDAALALPIVVDLEPRGRVRGRVVDAQGAPVAGQWSILTADGASWRDASNRPVAALTDADGRYDARWLAPGHYALTIEHEASLPYRAELEVRARATTEQDVALEARVEDPNAFLRGTVRSARGEYQAPVSVTAYPLEGSHRLRRTEVAWERDAAGELVGRFAFEGVEPFEHQVQLVTPDLFPVEPARIRALPGRDELAFVIDDARPPLALEVRAFDAPSGRPLERFLALATIAPGESRERARQVVGRAGVASVPGVPQGVALELRVRAEGYAPAWRDLDAVPDTRAVELRLEPGWGTDLTAVDAEGRPLAKVAISFDGEASGSTDERGRLRAVRATPPSTLRAVYGDWVLAPEGGVDPKTGRFRAWEPAVRVVLTPP